MDVRDLLMVVKRQSQLQDKADAHTTILDGFGLDSSPQILILSSDRGKNAQAPQEIPLNDWGTGAGAGDSDLYAWNARHV